MNKFSTNMSYPNNIPSNKKPMDIRQIVLYVVAIAFSVFTLMDLLGQ